MSLMDIVNSGVAIANSVTTDLQATVSYEKYLSTDGAGKKTYMAPVSIKALVEKKQRQVRSGDGQLSMCRAMVTILEPTVIVSVFDRLILPDGTTGPILDASGLIDSVTGHPILSEVYIG